MIRDGQSCIVEAWQVMYMQQFNRANEMLGQWMRAEHHRLHCVEAWPDSPQKEAVVAAIHSVLERLKASATFEPPHCMVCASRRAKAVVLEFRSRSQNSPALNRLAA